MLRRFHEILIWPLELVLPGSLRHLAEQAGLARELSAEIARRSHGLWRPIDVLDRGTTGDRGLRYAEFVYFHPFVQKVLYPSDEDRNPALAILARKDVKGAEVSLHGEKGTLKVEVKRVHLYLFRSQTALLAVEVASDVPMELPTALQFADQFRRAYPPFFQDGKGGHCPEKMRWVLDGEAADERPAESDFEVPTAMYEPVENAAKRRSPLAAHWRWLMKPLKCADEADAAEIRFEVLEDDRIPTMLYLGIDDPFTLTRGDFMRICFCDGAGDSDDLPYGPQFMADFESTFCYDRFWNEPKPLERKGDEWRFTRYLCSGYNFAVVTKPTGWGEDILLNHFRHHYFQAGLLAHFQRASLLKYSCRLTEVAAESIGPGDKHWESLTQVRREFADFINQYWFREISNQEQSKELFLLWSDRLGNRALLDQLSAEAAAVDRILKQQYEQNQEKFQSAQQSEMKKLQESTDRLTNALYWLTGFALVVAILDTQLVRQFAAYGGAWFVHHQWGDEFMMWWPLVALTIAGIGLGYLGLKRRLRALYDKKGGR